MKVKELGFYALVGVIIFAGQFLLNHGMRTGTPPAISQQTISGQDVMQLIKRGPAIVYFWAEWCGVCNMMQQPLSEVSKDYPVLTVAVKSGDEQNVQNYLNENALNWKVLNDPLGKIAEKYLARGVPSVFFLNQQGEIVLTASGYTSEIGLRLRLWLAEKI